MKFLQPLFLLAIIALSTTSCEQLNNLTVFDFDASPITFILNKTDAGEISFERDIPINIQKELEDRDYTEDKIESIIPKKVTLSLTDAGSDFDLSNVTDAKISIVTDSGEISIAELVTVISRGTNTVDLEVMDVELRDELLSDKIAYKATFVTNAETPQDAKLTISTTYAVDIKLL